MEKPNMFLNASGNLFQNARELRERETEAEKILWSRLSKSQLGLKFRRQHPMGTYVVDFYCHHKKLIIELDGSVHDVPEVKLNDGIRSEFLTSFGLKILRFRNEDVTKEIDRVVDTIKLALA